jgi:hypothetical protein
MLLVLFESPPWVGYNESDLKLFRPKVWEKLNFELLVIGMEIQLNYKNWFWNEKLVG